VARTSDLLPSPGAEIHRERSRERNARNDAAMESLPHAGNSALARSRPLGLGVFRLGLRDKQVQSPYVHVRADKPPRHVRTPHAPRPPGGRLPRPHDQGVTRSRAIAANERPMEPGWAVSVSSRCRAQDEECCSPPRRAFVRGLSFQTEARARRARPDPRSLPYSQGSDGQ
jgi:hypothetical protein